VWDCGRGRSEASGGAEVATRRVPWTAGQCIARGAVLPRPDLRASALRRRDPAAGQPEPPSSCEELAGATGLEPAASGVTGICHVLSPTLVEQLTAAATRRCPLKFRTLASRHLGSADQQSGTRRFRRRRSTRRWLRLAEASNNTREWKRVQNFLRASSQALHDRIFDFGLAAVTRAYGLPEVAPPLLFAVGRTVGWIAHVIEEYASGEVIRPKARYTGPFPDAQGAQVQRDDQ